MRRTTTSMPVSIAVGAVTGAVLALGLGLLAVAIVPDDGFADLGVAAFTTVIGVPAGAVIGAAVGWWVNHHHRRGDDPSGSGSAIETMSMV
ncbi:MAG: hypothetical protein HKN91_04695 [Acidimicrobiia bacterium]|nr:hypothetical protein [Acidimicrobiia bacterium]